MVFPSAAPLVGKPGVSLTQKSVSFRHDVAVHAVDMTFMCHPTRCSVKHFPKLTYSRVLVDVQLTSVEWLRWCTSWFWFSEPCLCYLVQVAIWVDVSYGEWVLRTRFYKFSTLILCVWAAVRTKLETPLVRFESNSHLGRLLVAAQWSFQSLMTQ